MRRIVFAILAFIGIISAAHGQALQRLTAPIPGLITTGSTFQILSAANVNRRSLQIQNNGIGSDNCWLLIGGPWVAGDTLATSRTVNGTSMTAAQAGMLLNPGVAYTRYEASIVPLDQILITCSTSADSYYADIQ
jgi:hypothetical protein